MSKAKAVNLATLTLSELKDKLKGAEDLNLKQMNRFEITQAVRKAAGQPLCADADKLNPRAIKPGIKALKAKLAETALDNKKRRKALRRAISVQKQKTRLYHQG